MNFILLILYYISYHFFDDLSALSAYDTVDSLELRPANESNANMDYWRIRAIFNEWTLSYPGKFYQQMVAMYFWRKAEVYFINELFPR